MSMKRVIASSFFGQSGAIARNGVSVGRVFESAEKISYAGALHQAPQRARSRGGAGGRSHGGEQKQSTKWGGERFMVTCFPVKEGSMRSQ
jgi:hypothetical protein